MTYINSQNINFQQKMLLFKIKQESETTIFGGKKIHFLEKYMMIIS